MLTFDSVIRIVGVLCFSAKFGEVTWFPHCTRMRKPWRPRDMSSTAMTYETVHVGEWLVLSKEQMPLTNQHNESA